MVATAMLANRPPPTETHKAEQVPAEHCAHPADRDVADHAEAAAAHQLSRQPARNQTHQYEPDDSMMPSCVY